MFLFEPLEEPFGVIVDFGVVGTRIYSGALLLAR